MVKVQINSSNNYDLTVSSVLDVILQGDNIYELVVA